MEAKKINELLNDMNELSECAGKISGVSLILRSSRIKEVDKDVITTELLDVVAIMESTLSTMRHTLFPIEQEDEDHEMVCD